MGVILLTDADLPDQGMFIGLVRELVLLIMPVFLPSERCPVEEMPILVDRPEILWRSGFGVVFRMNMPGVVPVSTVRASAFTSKVGGTCATSTV